METIERDVGEVDRRPLARGRGIARLAVYLYVAGAAAFAPREHLDLAVDVQPAGIRRPRHHRSEALHREDAIDRHSENPRCGVAVIDLRDGFHNRRAQLVEAGARRAAHGHDWL